MTTPATTTRKPRTELTATADEFNTIVDDIKKESDHFTDVKGRLQANGENPIMLGTQRFGKKELRSLESQLGKRFQSLKKYYASAIKAKGKRKRVVKPGEEKKESKAGFSNPMFISAKLQEFFSKADLGPVNPDQPVGPSNPELIKYLPLLTARGVTNSALLTPLFSIYVNRMALQANAERNKGKELQGRNNQYLGCNPEMDKVFGHTPCVHPKTGGLSEFSFLETQDAKNPRKDKNGNPITPFNRKDFRFASFQSVVALNRVSIKEELATLADKAKSGAPLSGPEQARLAELQGKQAELENKEVKDRLEQEFKVVQQVNNFYKAKNEPAQKAMRADRRRQQKAAAAATR